MLQLRIEKVQLILERKITVCKVALELHVSRKTIHKRICRYKKRWEEGLYPRKPWPKHGPPVNRTPERIEDIVVKIAQEYRFKGPITIGDLLEDEYNIKLDPTTIFRILRRRHVRYNNYYKRFKRPKRLYVLWNPWQEVQLDVSFPLWYEEDIVVYDMIDDCSRIVKTRAYEWRWIASSIAFIKHVLNTTTLTIKAVRTDNWGEFGKAFNEFLGNLWIKHIRNSRWAPEENGKIERYHRTRKDEDICNRWSWISIDDANYKLKLWEYHYNYKRKHRWLGMNGLTPIQKYHLCSLIKM